MGTLPKKGTLPGYARPSLDLQALVGMHAEGPPPPHIDRDRAPYLDIPSSRAEHPVNIAPIYG